MPIPANVVRVSLVWQMRAAWPNETAVNTFHMVPQSGSSGPAPDPQYVADQVASKLATHWSAVGALWAGGGNQITAVKTYLLDTTGHATAQGVHAVTSGTLPGLGTSGQLPPEVAVCLSLYAYPPGGFASQKGRKRGRMFLGPVSQALCTSDGRVSMGTADTYLDGFQTIINDLNTIESASGRTDPMGVVVLSRTGGATYEVVHIAMDDHFDAQRRRQHQDVPARHTRDITAW